MYFEIFRRTGLFKNSTIYKYRLPITEETFTLCKNVNSGSALLSPHPAPPSPPDPSYQDKSSLLTPPPKSSAWRPPQVSPSIRRAQLDQLRHSEKPKSWREEVGGTSTLVAGGDGGEVVVHPPSLQTLLISTHLMEMVVRSLSKLPLCRLC